MLVVPSWLAPVGRSEDSETPSLDLDVRVKAGRNTVSERSHTEFIVKGASSGGTQFI